MTQARHDRIPLLVEATANQVNQFGGYTGLRPSEFPAYVASIAERAGLRRDRIVLGGDHLGPVCWTDEDAHAAMAKACDLVTSYVDAGFVKIHLDTSMACADDPKHLDDQVVAERAAALCEVAERAVKTGGERVKPVYVIGTEVPPPGGATEKVKRLEVTTAERATRTMAVHRKAFVERWTGRRLAQGNRTGGAAGCRVRQHIRSPVRAVAGEAIDRGAQRISRHRLRSTFNGLSTSGCLSGIAAGSLRDSQGGTATHLCVARSTVGIELDRARIAGRRRDVFEACCDLRSGHERGPAGVDQALSGTGSSNTLVSPLQLQRPDPVLLEPSGCRGGCRSTVRESAGHRDSAPVAESVSAGAVQGCAGGRSSAGAAGFCHPQHHGSDVRILGGMPGTGVMKTCPDSRQVVNT